MKVLNLMCYRCKKEISKEFNVKIYAKHMRPTIGGSKHKKAFCSEGCYQDYLNEDVVEIYNGKPIFLVESEQFGCLYLPYKEAVYGFKTIKECKERMDNKYLAYIPSSIPIFYNF